VLCSLYLVFGLGSLVFLIEDLHQVTKAKDPKPKTKREVLSTKF